MPEDFQKIRQKLDAVSPSFCLAKWLQTTVYLQSGHTHSCHHPVSHRVPEEEVLAHPDALHNTRFKMLRRREMLEGKRPAECEYCWKIEDLSPSLMSDRLLKSSEPWALPELERISKLRWDARVMPAYLEVSFSNTCNFKCAYCNPYASSKWMEEIREFGPYPTYQSNRKHNGLEFLERSKKMPIPESEPNPYVDAFWKWWPDLAGNLKTLRITGGEPLLTKNTFRILDSIVAEPRPRLDFAVNSNLGVPRKVLEQFVTKVSEILRGKKVKTFSLYTSLDSWGKQAEYIRFGMNFDEYWENVRFVLEKLPEAQLTFMCTVNAMSVPGLGRLLEGVYALKQEFGLISGSGLPRVMIDLPYLREPEFLSARILPGEFAATLDECLSFVEARRGGNAFIDIEHARIKRIVDWFKAPGDDDWTATFRGDFYRFVTTYDKRRELHFEEVFPELRNFFKVCFLEGVADNSK